MNPTFESARSECFSIFLCVCLKVPVTHPSLWARWILRQGGVINGIIGVTCEGHRNGISCAPNDLLHMVEVLRTRWEEWNSTCRRWKEREDNREKQEKGCSDMLKNSIFFLQIFYSPPPNNNCVYVWQLLLHFIVPAIIVAFHCSIMFHII